MDTPTPYGSYHDRRVIIPLWTDKLIMRMAENLGGCYSGDLICGYGHANNSSQRRRVTMRVSRTLGCTLYGSSDLAVYR
jgi:hypothetical protein